MSTMRKQEYPTPRPAPDLREMANAARASVDRRPSDRKLTPREVILKVSYRNPKSGVRMKADVTSRIMSDSERRATYLMMNQMAGGPWENLPPDVRQHIAAVANCSQQLRNVPGWLWEAMGENPVLALVLFKEVQEHELRYFQGDDPEGETSEERWGVEVVSPFADTAPPAAVGE